MKITLYWMIGCPHCQKIKNELKNISANHNVVEIEKTYITSHTKNKYGITKYPTLVFLTDNNVVLDKLVGFATEQQIQAKIKGCERLDKLHKRNSK